MKKELDLKKVQSDIYSILYQFYTVDSVKVQIKELIPDEQETIIKRLLNLDGAYVLNVKFTANGRAIIINNDDLSLFKNAVFHGFFRYHDLIKNKKLVINLLNKTSQRKVKNPSEVYLEALRKEAELL